MGRARGQSRGKIWAKNDLKISRLLYHLWESGRPEKTNS